MQALQRVESLDGLPETVRKPSKPSSASERYSPPASCDIEDLLAWTYGRQEVHRKLRAEQRGGSSSASSGAMDSVIKVQMNWIHGGRISGGGMPPGLPFAIGELEVETIHPDALTVHAALIVLDELSVGLVIKHAWERSRPDWGGDLMALEPKRNRKGKVEMMYDNNRNEAGALLDPDAALYNRSVMLMRDRYEHWWCAMALLQDDLVARGALTHIAIHPPRAPLRPWAAARAKQTG